MLLYKAVLVSAAQQSDSVIYILNDFINGKERENELCSNVV